MGDQSCRYQGPCDREPEPGRSQCAYHRARKTDSLRKYRARKLSMSQCVLHGCRSPLVSGRKFCEDHLVAARQKSRIYKELNRERVIANYDPEKTRAKNLATYGLTLESYDRLLRAQGEVCAICGEVEPTAGRNLAVDHDHNCCPGKGSCGKCVRGLLCGRCNKALGLLGDDVGRLEIAIDYLNGGVRWQT